MAAAEEKKAPVAVKSKKSPSKTNRAAARPVVSVYNLNGRQTGTMVAMPDVMVSPIRADIVQFVHTNMAKNSRQPYAVKYHMGPKGIQAGMQVSARSWGTGRAVSRIPRVRGGGTHRAGQGAVANICRGGRMFAPTKTYRRWHRKINTNEKRYAVASAVAASAVPALVMARGHRIQRTQEIPIVVDGAFESLEKTRDAQATLNALRLGPELRRCKRRYKRAGRGKARNRRWKNRRGPLIVYRHDNGIVAAARNIRGIDFCRVDQLNLLKLSPGGHVGRLVIWTEPAFRHLNYVFGTSRKASSQKNGYNLPRPVVMNSDLPRILNNNAIQSVLTPKKRRARVYAKRNPLRRPELFARLNPLFAKQYKELMAKFEKNGKKPSNTRALMRPLQKKTAG